MWKRALRKCVFILCCILLMCPKRIRSVSLTKEKHKPLHSKALSESMSSSEEDAPNTIDKDNEELSNSEEPGFDFTDEEMVKFNIWPYGVVPYYIDVHSFSDKVLRDRIRSFLNTVNTATSLNFMELPSPPRDDKTRWVFFINRRGLLTCGDHSVANFTNQGVQKVVLGYDCMSTAGELAEAVLSVVGVPAQHNAPNRDEYIQVIDKNIMPEKKYLFNKFKDNQWLFHDINYDYNSAGHYHCHKYSVNGQATIISQEIHDSIGESNTLSTLDILKIKMMYNHLANKKQNIPECHQLFVPGADFQKYRPNVPKFEPRKKPSKYLGVSDKDDDNTPEDGKPAPNDNQEDLSNEKHTDNANTDQDIKQVESSDGNDEYIPSTPLKHQFLNSKDPITYLSDYQTDDYANIRLRAKKTPP